MIARIIEPAGEQPADQQHRDQDRGGDVGDLLRLRQLTPCSRFYDRAPLGIETARSKLTTSSLFHLHI